MKPKDETGNRYGRLKVIKRVPNRLRLRYACWLCICKCGRKKVVFGFNLRSGKSQSCGCLNIDATKKANTKHGGYANHKSECNCWQAMIARCYNPKHPRYDDWGGRGIRVCKRWRDSFEKFFVDMGPRPKGLTLEREDNDGDYTPKNCCWTTYKQQSHNQRPRGSGVKARRSRALKAA